MTQVISKYLKYYLSGKGLDTSRKQIIKNARHFFQESDSQYHFYPSGKNKLENYDFVYNKDLFTQSKYYPILFKEWFSLIKIGGRIILQFKPTNLKTTADYKEEIEVLMTNKGEIIYEEKNGEWISLVIKKDKSVLLSGDDINKWTFGIITVGKRNEWVDRIIDSIKSLQIPQYEIIICGIYHERPESNIKYIHFIEGDDRGWITKKKNLICEAAKYENLCITNDRIMYNNNWFEGMKKYGNCFESLGCVQTLSSGQRVGDWFTFGGECTRVMGMPFKLGLIDYQDWDEWSYVVGSLNIVKKSVWKEVKWDETLYWKDALEDGIFCHQLKRKGYLTRINPYSSCLALSWRHGLLPFYTFNKNGLGKLTGAPVRRFAWFILRNIRNTKIQRNIIPPVYRLLLKLKLLNFIINH